MVNSEKTHSAVIDLTDLITKGPVASEKKKCTEDSASLLFSADKKKRFADELPLTTAQPAHPFPQGDTSPITLTSKPHASFLSNDSKANHGSDKEQKSTFAAMPSENGSLKQTDANDQIKAVQTKEIHPSTLHNEREKNEDTVSSAAANNRISPLVAGMLPGLTEKIGGLSDKFSLFEDRVLRLSSRLTQLEKNIQAHTQKKQEEGCLENTSLKAEFDTTVQQLSTRIVLLEKRLKCSENGFSSDANNLLDTPSGSKDIPYTKKCPAQKNDLAATSLSQPIFECPDSLTKISIIESKLASLDQKVETLSAELNDRHSVQNLQEPFSSDLQGTPTSNLQATPNESPSEIQKFADRLSACEKQLTIDNLERLAATACSRVLREEINRLLTSQKDDITPTR